MKPCVERLFRDQEPCGSFQIIRDREIEQRAPVAVGIRTLATELRRRR